MNYIITGSKENGSPNVEILYFGNNIAETKEVFEKLIRLNDLQFPETENLKKEHDELVNELEDKHSVVVFSEDERIEDAYVEWKLGKISRIEEVV